LILKSYHCDINLNPTTERLVIQKGIQAKLDRGAHKEPCMPEQKQPLFIPAIITIMLISFP